MFDYQSHSEIEDFSLQDAKSTRLPIILYNSHPWRTHQHPISSTVAGSFKRGIPTYPPFPPPSSTQKKAVWSLPQEFWVHHSASVLWINWQDSNSRFELPPSPEKPPKKPWTTWNRLPCWNFHHNAVWRAGPEAVIDRLEWFQSYLGQQPTLRRSKKGLYM